MWSLTKPADEEVEQFLARVADAPCSYDEVGISQDAIDGESWRGDRDAQRGLLGEGEAVYRAACEAITRWQMFPAGWTEILPRGIAPTEGDVVALVIRTYGLWFRCACRVIYTVDDPGPVRRFGFAYGTLADHVETGEERFLVEWDEDDRVWYDLRAWSRPRHILTRVGYPVARHQQARFRRESLAAMQEAVR